MDATASQPAAAAPPSSTQYNLADLGLVGEAETPVTLDVLHPKSKAEVGLYIDLVGKDSEAYRALARKLQNKRFAELRKTRSLTMTAEQNEEETVRLLGATVRSWRSRLFKVVAGKQVPTEEFSPTFYNGKEYLECNVKNVEWVLRNCPEIREQVEDFIDDRTNFLKGSSAS